ncbi:MAG: phytanoyl-CoA dioxygenase family protein, partial [Geodermatophilaceae bacterium]|nr:phytanoyl-CoA dioxygenase family protein [Geodermatophilaceae bacterium]
TVRDRGVAVVPNFVPTELLRTVNQALPKLLGSSHALAFPKSTRVWDLYRHGEPFRELLKLPQLETLMRELLGAAYLLSDYSLNVVNPQQPQDDWHLDYPFNEMERLVQGALLGVQCVVTLDTFTAKNGATQVYAGSHLPARRPDPRATATYDTVQTGPGSLVIMAASAWHRSGHNAARKPRAGILMSFVERWVRPMNDPPEPGPWSTTKATRIMLGMERPPETINGHPIEGTID